MENEQTQEVVDRLTTYADETIKKPLVVKKDIPYGDLNKNKLDIMFPASATGKNLPVVFLLHGGAWGAGNKENQ